MSRAPGRVPCVLPAHPDRPRRHRRQWPGNQTLQENQDAILVQAGGGHYECLLRLHPYPGGNDGVQSFIGGRSKTAGPSSSIRFGPAVWPCGYGSRGEPQLFRSGWKFGHAVSQQPGFTVRPATQYFANTHPSIGNYFMLTTGQLVTNDDAFTGTVAWTISFAN